MSGLTITTLAQQIEDLIVKSEQQTNAVSAWLGGSATGGPNNDGRYPFVDLSGQEILVPSPASFNDMTSGPAAQAAAAKVAAELARDLANEHANRADAQRILSEAARGAAVEARNLSQQHRDHAGTSESNARYWAELAQGSGQSTSADRAVVEDLAEQVADNAALASQKATAAAASAAQAATFDPTLYDKKSDTLAASRLTGVIDRARIPVLPSGRQFASSGGLPQLTSAQQAEIGEGSIITTTDGMRYVYTGQGSKTVAASYTLLADITPDFDALANKPPFYPSNIVNVAGLQSALDLKAPKANAVFSTPISVNGAVGAHSFSANHSLFYPDGNHTVIKTGPGGSERYWRFDDNGTFYSLNGGIYSNYNMQAMGSVIVGGGFDANRVNVEKGWIELRNDGYGPYVDFSTDATTDFHARISVPRSDGRLWLSSALGGSVIVGPTIEANSNNGSQSGSVLTHAGSEQVMSKQLTFPSAMNPQDAGAGAHLEVRGAGSGYGAWMKFHRPGQYGTYFGMFEDGKWGFGGWSTGATIHEFWTSKNFDPLSRMERYNDGWIQTRDANDRFYFASNGRSYYKSKDGHEWRNGTDVNIGSLDKDGHLNIRGDLALANRMTLRGTNPTIVLRDTDNRSGMIHVNANKFYVLRGAGNDAEGWESTGGGWPLEIDLENNNATFGANIYTGVGHWFRVRGDGNGIFWEQWGGGFHMSDASWVRVYNGKNFYCSAQIRGNTVVGESDRRLKANIATITNATQKVEALTGVTFNWKRTGSAGMGFIAQDFEPVLPFLVTENTDGMKGVEYGPVVALLVEALKETNTRVAVLEGRV